jgi:hypothetical protein
VREAALAQTRATLPPLHKALAVQRRSPAVSRYFMATFVFRDTIGETDRLRVYDVVDGQQCKSGAMQMIMTGQIERPFPQKPAAGRQRR